MPSVPSMPLPAKIAPALVPPTAAAMPPAPCFTRVFLIVVAPCFLRICATTLTTPGIDKPPGATPSNVAAARGLPDIDPGCAKALAILGSRSVLLLT